MIEDQLFGDIPAFSQNLGVRYNNPNQQIRQEDSTQQGSEMSDNAFKELMNTPLSGEEVAEKIAYLNEEGTPLTQNSLSYEEWEKYHEWHKEQSSDFWGALGEGAKHAAGDLASGIYAAATDWKKLAAATGLSVAASPLVGIGTVYGSTLAEGAARGVRDLSGLFVTAFNNPNSPLYRLVNPSGDKKVMYQDFLDLAQWNQSSMDILNGKSNLLMPDKSTYEKLLGKQMGEQFHDVFGVNHDLATAASYILDPVTLLSMGTGKFATILGKSALKAGIAVEEKALLAATAQQAKASWVSSTLNQGSRLVDSGFVQGLQKVGGAAEKIAKVVTVPLEKTYNVAHGFLDDIFGKGIVRIGQNTATARKVTAGRVPNGLAHAIVASAGTYGLFHIPYGGTLASLYAGAKVTELAGASAKGIGKRMAMTGKGFFEVSRDMNAVYAKSQGSEGKIMTGLINKSEVLSGYMGDVVKSGLKGAAFGAAIEYASTGEVAGGIGSGFVIGGAMHGVGSAYGSVSGVYRKQNVLKDFDSFQKDLTQKGYILQRDNVNKYIEDIRQDYGDDVALRTMSHVLSITRAEGTAVTFLRRKDIIDALKGDPSTHPQLYVCDENGKPILDGEGKPTLSAVGESVLSGVQNGGWNGMFQHVNPETGVIAEKPYAIWNDGRTGNRHVIINIDGYLFDRDASGNIVYDREAKPVVRKEYDVSDETISGNERIGTKIPSGEEWKKLPEAERKAIISRNAKIDAARRARKGNLEVGTREGWKTLTTEQKNKLLERDSLKNLDETSLNEVLETHWKTQEAKAELAKKGNVDERRKALDEFEENTKNDLGNIQEQEFADAKNPSERKALIEGWNKKFGKEKTARFLEEIGIKETTTQTRIVQSGTEQVTVEGKRPTVTVKRPKGTVGPESGVVLKGKLLKEKVEVQGPGVPTEVTVPRISEITDVQYSNRKVARRSSTSVLEEMFHMYGDLQRTILGDKLSIRDEVKNWFLGDGISKGKLELEKKEAVELLHKAIDNTVKDADERLTQKTIISEMAEGKINQNNIAQLDLMFEELSAKMFLAWEMGKPFDYIYRGGDLGLMQNVFMTLQDRYAQHVLRDAGQLGGRVRTEQHFTRWFEGYEGKNKFKFDRTLDQAFKRGIRVFRDHGMKDAGSGHYSFTKMTVPKMVAQAEQLGYEEYIARDKDGNATGMKTQEEIHKLEHAKMLSGVIELLDEAYINPEILNGLDIGVSERFGDFDRGLSIDEMAAGKNIKGIHFFQMSEQGFGKGLEDIRQAQEGQPSTGTLPPEVELLGRDKRRRTSIGPEWKLNKDFVRELKSRLLRVSKGQGTLIFTGVPGEAAMKILEKHFTKHMSNNLRKLSMPIFDGGKTSENVMTGLYHGFEHTDSTGYKHSRQFGDTITPRNVTFIPYEMDIRLSFRNAKSGTYDWKQPHAVAIVKGLDMDVLQRRIDTLWEEDHSVMKKLYADKSDFETHVYQTMSKYAGEKLIPAREFFGNDEEAWSRRNYAMAAIGAFPNKDRKSINSNILDQDYHRFLNRKDELNVNGYNNPWTRLRLDNLRQLKASDRSKTQIQFTEKTYYRGMIPSPKKFNERFYTKGSNKPIMYQIGEESPTDAVSARTLLEANGVDISKFKSDRDVQAAASKFISDPIKLVRQIAEHPAFKQRPNEQPLFQPAETYGALSEQDRTFLAGNFGYANTVLGDVYKSEALKRFVQQTAGPEAPVLRATLGEHEAMGGTMDDYNSSFKTGQPVVVTAVHGTRSKELSATRKFDESKFGEKGGFMHGSNLAAFHSGRVETASGYATDLGGVDTGHILTSALSFKNPLVVDFANEKYPNQLDYLAQAAKGGHDGLIALNVKRFKLDNNEPVVDNFYATLRDKTGSNIAVLGSNRRADINYEHIEGINRGLHGNENTSLMQISEELPSNIFGRRNEETRLIADEYCERFAINTPRQNAVIELNNEKSAIIGRLYDEMESRPNDPDVRMAYEAMARETIEQFKSIIAKGYTVRVFDGKAEPYKNSAEMLADVRNNKSLTIYPTGEAFGASSETVADYKNHPLLADSGFKDVNGVPLLVNDVFRYVHDFFGHTELGNSFGAIGEENAWTVHSRMYTPLARRAMTAETRGQNSWVNSFNVNNKAKNAILKQARIAENAGNHDGAKALRKKVEDMGGIEFAPQKVGLLPEWVSKLDSEYTPEESKKVGTHRFLMQEGEPVDAFEIESAKGIEREAKDLKPKKRGLPVGEDMPSEEAVLSEQSTEGVDRTAAIKNKISAYSKEIQDISKPDSTEQVEGPDGRMQTVVISPERRKQAIMDIQKQIEKESSKLQSIEEETGPSFEGRNKKQEILNDWLRIAQTYRANKNAPEAQQMFEMNKVLRQIQEQTGERISWKNVKEYGLKVEGKRYGIADITESLVTKHLEELFPTKKKEVQTKPIDVQSEPIEDGKPVIGKYPINAEERQTLIDTLRRSDITSEQRRNIKKLLSNRQQLSKEDKATVKIAQGLWKKFGWDDVTDSFTNEELVQHSRATIQTFDGNQNYKEIAFSLIENENIPLEVEVYKDMFTPESQRVLEENYDLPEGSQDPFILHPSTLDRHGIQLSDEVIDAAFSDELSKAKSDSERNSIIQRINKIKQNPISRSAYLDYVRSILPEPEAYKKISSTKSEKLITFTKDSETWKYLLDLADEEVKKSELDVAQSTRGFLGEEVPTTRTEYKEFNPSRVSAEELYEHKWTLDDIKKYFIPHPTADGMFRLNPEYSTLVDSRFAPIALEIPLTFREQVRELSKINSRAIDFANKWNTLVNQIYEGRGGRKPKQFEEANGPALRKEFAQYLKDNNMSWDALEVRLAEMEELSAGKRETLTPLERAKEELPTKEESRITAGHLNMLLAIQYKTWEDTINNLVNNPQAQSVQERQAMIDSLLRVKEKYKLGDNVIVQKKDGTIKIGDFAEQTSKGLQIYVELPALMDILGDSAARDLFEIRSILGNENSLESMPKEIRDAIESGTEIPKSKAWLAAEAEFNAEKEIAAKEYADLDPVLSEESSAGIPEASSESSTGFSAKVIAKRAKLVETWNKENQGKISIGETPRTVETISDAEIVGLRWRAKKNGIPKDVDAEGKRSSQRNKLPSELTPEDLMTAYEAAFKEVKTLLRNPQDFDFTSPSALAEAEVAIYSKVVKNGASATLSVAEKKALTKTADNLKLEDGTTRDGQYSVSTKEKPSGGTAKVVKRNQTESNPHTSQPMPEQVIAIVNNEVEAVAALRKHEEDVRANVEVVTGKPTKNPLDSPVPEPTPEQVNALLEQAREVDNADPFEGMTQEQKEAAQGRIAKLKKLQERAAQRKAKEDEPRAINPDTGNVEPTKPYDYKKTQAQPPKISNQLSQGVKPKPVEHVPQSKKPVAVQEAPTPSKNHQHFESAVGAVMSLGESKQVAINLVNMAIGGDMNLTLETIIKKALGLKAVVAKSVLAAEVARDKNRVAPSNVIAPPKVTILPPVEAPKPQVSTPAPVVTTTPAASQIPVSAPSGMPVGKPVQPKPVTPRWAMNDDVKRALTEFQAFQTQYPHGSSIRQGITYVNDLGYVMQQVGLSKWRIFNPGKVYINSSNDEQDAVNEIFKDYNKR